MKDKINVTPQSEGHAENTEKKIVTLPLDRVRRDCGTQIRAKINEETVKEYAEAMRNGVVFPAGVTFHDGVEYFLADGFHRSFGWELAGFKEMEFEVRIGTRADALRYALSANAKHGLKRTNADKRRSVELALAEWPKLSNREIARICAVDESLVRDARQNNCGNPAVGETRIGADGKERRMPSAIASVRPSCASATPAPSEQREATSVPILGLWSLSAQESINQDELREILARPPIGIKEGVAKHLDVTRDDAQLLLEAFRENAVDAEELLAVAAELRLTTKLLEGFARQLTKSTN